MTDIVVDKVTRNSRLKNLTAAWKVLNSFLRYCRARIRTYMFQEQDILAKWEASSWAKKLKSKKTRANLSDFDRFKVMIAKKQKAKIVSDKLAELAK